MWQGGSIRHAALHADLHIIAQFTGKGEKGENINQLLYLV